MTQTLETFLFRGREHYKGIMVMRVVVCFRVWVQETWGPKHPSTHLMDLTSDLELDPSLNIVVSQLGVFFKKFEWGPPLLEGKWRERAESVVFILFQNKIKTT